MISFLSSLPYSSRSAATKLAVTGLCAGDSQTHPSLPERSSELQDNATNTDPELNSNANGGQRALTARPRSVQMQFLTFVCVCGGGAGLAPARQVLATKLHPQPARAPNILQGLI